MEVIESLGALECTSSFSALQQQSLKVLNILSLLSAVGRPSFSANLASASVLQEATCMRCVW